MRWEKNRSSHCLNFSCFFFFRMENQRQTWKFCILPQNPSPFLFKLQRNGVSLFVTVDSKLKKSRYCACLLKKLGCSHGRTGQAIGPMPIVSTSCIRSDSLSYTPLHYKTHHIPVDSLDWAGNFSPALCLTLFFFLSTSLLCCKICIRRNLNIFQIQLANFFNFKHTFVNTNLGI